MSPRLLAAAGVAVLVLAGFGLAGMQTLRLSWLQQSVAEEHAAAAEVGRLRERAAGRTFNAQVSALQGVTDAKDRALRRVRADLDSALDELRQRPDRPVPGDAAAAGPCAGATGAELFRADAEFLAREAARADDLRAELGACQQRERAVREQFGLSVP